MLTILVMLENVSNFDRMLAIWENVDEEIFLGAMMTNVGKFGNV